MIRTVAGDVSRPLAHLGSDAVFLVWGPPSHGPRSRVFARELGIDIRFIRSTARRGMWAAPFKYASQAIKTLSLLRRQRPRVVFVQSPPSFAVIAVWLYCSLNGALFVVDAHSAAMQMTYWTRPRWLYRFLACRAVATIVTGEHFARRVRRSGGRALVVRDIPTTFPTDGAVPVEGGSNVMVVSSFAPDEPLDRIIAAARDLPEVTFHLTGDGSRALGRLPRVPSNVRPTGFLPDESYYALMRASQVVMCLTTRDHTMQRGACEALSMGKPIITSDHALLRSYFHLGTVHVVNTTTGIRDGVREMLRNLDRYAAEIEQLQIEQEREWDEAVRSLIPMLAGAGSGATNERYERGV